MLSLVGVGDLFCCIHCCMAFWLVSVTAHGREVTMGVVTISILDSSQDKAIVDTMVDTDDVWTSVAENERL